MIHRAGRISGLKKRGRRATRLKDLTLSRSGNETLAIEFDNLTLNPVGPNSVKFKSFLALLGRSKASILANDWDHIEERVKDQIWQNILLTFDVPDTKQHRKKCITFAGERWRAFKTQLTSQYIFGPLKDTSPCEKYVFLEEEEWRKFVQSRQDPAFLEKRKKGQMIQAKNLHPHRLSRGGYELLEERMMQEKLIQRQIASQADPAILTGPPSPPKRHDKWKRARQQKSGEYTSEDTRLVAEKIDSLVEQSSQGSFVQHGRQDILTTAIGRPDHPGRVRAVGRGVGIRQYFGKAGSRYDSTNKVDIREELEVLKEQMREDIIREMRHDLRQEISSELKKELTSMGFFPQNPIVEPSRSPNVSTKGSNICAAEHISDRWELYVDPHRLVAIGKIYNLGPTIHQKIIGDDHVRVVVEEVLDTNARVPVPTEEVQTVGQAPNNFILWPRILMNLVSTKDINDFSKQDVPPKRSELIEPLDQLGLVAFKLGSDIVELNLEHDTIEGYSIAQKDIIELCMREEMLCITVIQLWLTYLHRLSISKGTFNLYGFLDPLPIQSSGNKPEEIQSYIQKRLHEGKKECYLAPYHTELHWQLLIICPRQNVVVFLCSLGKKPSKGLKNLVDTAVEASQMLGGRRPTSKTKPKWIFPNSPRQPGSYECGYYVMRHMLNVVSASIVDLWAERFNNPDPLSIEDMNDIRKRWAMFFLDITNNLE